MAEIRNYTMNFGSGPLDGITVTLNFRKRKLASLKFISGNF